jgi:hypothetical protein
MAAIVEFVGAAVAVGAGASKVWSYGINLTDADTVVVGHRIGLGFPADLPIVDPATLGAVTELAGSFLLKGAGASRQYTGRVVTAPGKQVISFVAPDGATPCEVLLVTSEVGQPWQGRSFTTTSGGDSQIGQLLPAPAAASTVPTRAKPVTNGSPAADFTGTLPYASEVFGVYQPLAGWLGRRSTERTVSFARAHESASQSMTLFAGPEARMARSPVLVKTLEQLGAGAQGVLSPVGLVTLFREYFFEFDNFLGAPSGHLWISPGGTVEVIESSTRRTLTQRTATQQEDSTQKIEESLTDQNDVADAVKEDNANDTKLGASANAGAKFAGIYHADASASFSNQSTTHKSSELTHKHTRTQSSKVSSEIHRNFQTTFKTVTETTDVSSRRYVVQNTTQKLVNYELRRKMRKVGVQVQHIGTRLSWQVFMDLPGTDLGLGELVHVVPAPDLSSLRKPEKPPPLQPKEVEFTTTFTMQKFPGTKNAPHQDANYTRSGENTGGLTGMHSDDNDDHIVGDAAYNAPPPAPGYTISAIRTVSAKTQGGDAQFLANYDWIAPSAGAFRLKAQFLNFAGGRIITVTVAITWAPPAINPADAQYKADLAAYDLQVADLQRKAYGEAIRNRMKLASNLRRRPPEDLRKEERYTVYGKLIRDLQLFTDPHIGSELIRQIFDVDEMLYFAAPDYWRPRPANVPARTSASQGRYPVPAVPGLAAAADPLEGETMASWYSHTDHDNVLDPSGKATPEWRLNYLVTEDTQPPPFGSSLGWLIQIDGDERRNEFLNAAWVKAVLPIRAGHEIEALQWLGQAKVEGEAGLGQPYPFQPGDPAEYVGKSMSEVLELLAAELQAANTDIANTLAIEKVFENGFDPLGGGFRRAEPYQIFDEWLEVLPTDQVVAVEVTYDSQTGKQL